jgi:hypothetical protein
MAINIYQELFKFPTYHITTNNSIATTKLKPKKKEPFRELNIPVELYESMFQTGSTVICNPPVLDTDIDHMIYTETVRKLDGYLRSEGFNYTSKEGSGGGGDKPIYTYRREKLNLIVTDSNDFFTKFKEATILATKLNLREKPQRIALFEYIVDGVL